LDNRDRRLHLGFRVRIANKGFSAPPSLSIANASGQPNKLVEPHGHRHRRLVAQRTRGCGSENVEMESGDGRVGRGYIDGEFVTGLLAEDYVFAGAGGAKLLDAKFGRFERFGGFLPDVAVVTDVEDIEGRNHG